ncbi:hypothetical protein EC9793_03834 [Escherichia coli O145:H28]|nr:hypothetical protein EC9793_03834 [Escherichia coli O145:H28]
MQFDPAYVSLSRVISWILNNKLNFTVQSKCGVAPILDVR